MSAFTFTSPDGKQYTVNGPDGATHDQAFQVLQTQLASGSAQPDQPVRQPIKPVEPDNKSWLENKLDSALMFLAKPSVEAIGDRNLDKMRGVAMGAADPSIGALQLAAHATGIGKDSIDNAIKQKGAEYERQRAMDGRSGIDAYRLAGNVASPVNAIPAGYLSRATSLARLAGRGAVVGAAMGAAQPVTDTDNYAQQKSGQTAVGAATGALATPIISVAATGLGRLVNGVMQSMRGPVSPPQAASMADKILSDWASSPESKTSGFDLSKIPGSVVDSVKQRISQSLAAGKTIDPAALIRQSDFDAVGVQPTQGQLTRNPMQFAKERDMRGVDLGGVANGLSDRFAQQGQQLRQVFPGASGADDSYGAGNKLIQALRATDEPKQQAVSKAYGAARDTTGRYANVDVPAFSQAANEALDSGMLGHYLPAETKNLLNDISSGKIPLNVNNLVQVDSVMSAAQRSAAARGDKAAQMAIGKVRDALNAAPVESSTGVDAKAAFDTARGMAKDRFSTIENNPALKAALDGEDPDKFVNKYVINGTTDDLKSLTKLLQQRKEPSVPLLPAPEGTPPSKPVLSEANQLIKSQVASYLKKKAFGVDTSGDNQFSPAAFNKALDSMGKEKLAAVFSPEELNKLYAAGRVMSYIKTQPEGSAVNNSNTGAAVMNLLSQMSGKIGAFPGINIVRNSIRNYQNERAVAQALRAQVPTEDAALPQTMQAVIRALRSAGPAAGGAVAGAVSNQQ